MASMQDGEEDEENAEEDEGEENDNDNEDKEEGEGEEDGDDGLKVKDVVAVVASDVEASKDAVESEPKSTIPIVITAADDSTPASPTPAPAEKPPTGSPAASERPGSPAVDAKPASPVPVSPSPAAAPAEHHDLPSNAIELTNTAPGHTELGHGDLGTEASIEISKPTLEASASMSPSVAKEASPEKALASAEEGNVDGDGDVVMDENKEGEKTDEGLVMGEMEPPTGQEVIQVIGGDGEPPEVEK